ncbi:hypothetical protein [Nocardioides sp. NPDC047086]|uniref:hypothetical protein n=1 Tax=Nocardioides sp. NPDC047086 TaxID=3154810 RepID=UPI0033EB7334
MARGVDVGTVKEWMGHESIATTNLYLHFLGTGADAAGLDRLNDSGHRGAQKNPGAPGGGHKTKERASEKEKTPSVPH